ncbi:protein PSK SIMULATOR 1-like [Solanum verrucosum]|uniref:protein PSK SIMULATOR 1-like n=1 Tax=Solanum verrucosum TaxID=315347 RepID=UPI0020D02BF7|nr:protein PSK SIMULATOR 1-like [Solanum verrucosum]
MGGFCSRRATADSTTDHGIPHVNGHLNYGAGTVYQSRGLPIQLSSDPMQSPAGESQQLTEPALSYPEMNDISLGIPMDDVDDGIPILSRVLSNKSRSARSKQVAIAKVSEMSSLLGRAGTAGIGKAVNVLDTLGSSMTNLNLSSGFVSNMATKGNKIAILAFEVANTIVKAANLMHSLSEENVQHLKKVVLPSEGVQLLITKDMDELLRIAAADKRDELKIFSDEVVRFGNRCKDPQWHNLERYFEKLESELTPHKNLKEEAEAVMVQLMILVQYTAELYHEFHALDRFEQDYRRKVQEEDTSNATQRGDTIAILKAELKSQRKHVKNLEKKSLWSKILEEVTEKLVDIVHFLHLEIHAAFGCADGERSMKNNNQRLGSAGLALHYANIITQIDTIVARPGSVPPNTRDALYHGLPPSIKSALRFKLMSFSLKEELTVPQIKGEMEKTLQWLVPMAANTTKAHHGFGWVGEWANTGSEMNRKSSSQVDLLRIETLYHADKEKTEAYILELVVWLHHLVSQSKSANAGVKSPTRSPNQKTIELSNHRSSSPSSPLSVEDQEMLRDVSKRKLTPGISKSQEFAKTGLSKYHRLSKSSSHSPINETRKNPFPIKRPSSVPVIDFDTDRMKALDVIDRVDSIRGA